MGLIKVHVVPRAKRTEVVGGHGDAIRIRLAAPPVDGAANAELVRFLAKRLGVVRASVRIKSGAGARRKIVEVAGRSSDDVRRLLLTADG
jgi:uncharacterized protein (TIGR00251 family)